MKNKHSGSFFETLSHDGSWYQLKTIKLRGKWKKRPPSPYMDLKEYKARLKKKLDK